MTVHKKRKPGTSIGYDIGDTITGEPQTITDVASSEPMKYVKPKPKRRRKKKA